MIQEDEMELLKPCPFCGGMAISYKDDLGLRVFRCQDCGLVAKFKEHLFDDEEHAAEPWNRRDG